jgi:hypothetical protein
MNSEPSAIETSNVPSFSAFSIFVHFPLKRGCRVASNFRPCETTILNDVRRKHRDVMAWKLEAVSFRHLIALPRNLFLYHGAIRIRLNAFGMLSYFSTSIVCPVKFQDTFYSPYFIRWVASS